LWFINAFTTRVKNKRSPLWGSCIEVLKCIEDVIITRRERRAYFLALPPGAVSSCKFGILKNLKSLPRLEEAGGGLRRFRRIPESLRVLSGLGASGLNVQEKRL